MDNKQQFLCMILVWTINNLIFMGDVLSTTFSRLNGGSVLLCYCH